MCVSVPCKVEVEDEFRGIVRTTRSNTGSSLWPVWRSPEPRPLATRQRAPRPSSAPGTGRERHMPRISEE